MVAPWVVELLTTSYSNKPLEKAPMPAFVVANGCAGAGGETSGERSFGRIIPDQKTPEGDTGSALEEAAPGEIGEAQGAGAEESKGRGLGNRGGG